MTCEQLIQELMQQGITHPAVLDAIRAVPRNAFVPEALQARAWDNTALPIGNQQTISQPYVVALMTQALMGCPSRKKVLEIGTGSGYQCAILSQLFEKVYSIERIESLHQHSNDILTYLGYQNIETRLANGTEGWPEAAPFDAIIVTACAERIPRAYFEQLSEQSGHLVIPLGKTHGVQDLSLFIKTPNHLEETILEKVCFVPLVSNKK